MTNQEIFVDGEYDYDLITDENTYCLHYSNAEHWTHKGELVLGLENTGNDYKIIGLEKKGRLNYSESEELYILLAAVKDSKIEVVTDKKEI